MKNPLMKKKFLIAAVVAVDLAALFFVVVPQYQQAKDSQDQSAAAQAYYESKMAYSAAVLREIKEIDTRASAFQKIDDALPTGFSSSTLTYFLQQTSGATGIAIQSVTFSQNQPATTAALAKAQGNQLKEMSFDIAMSGTYDQLKSFLAALEKSDRLFEVDSINFLSASNSTLPTAPQYDFKLRVKTHYY